MKPTPLAWVKVWTDNDGDWLTMPLEDRAVFYELVKLGGRGWPRGSVRGQDAAIAPMLGIPAGVFTASVDRLCAKPHKSVKRVAGGLKVVNWDKYQAPAMALSHAQRGSSPHREKTRQEETRQEPEWLRAALATLEGVAGYPFDRIADADLLTRLATKYPTVDTRAGVESWAFYKIDKPLTEGQSPRSQLNTWFAKSVEYGRDLRTKGADLTPEQIRERLRVVS